MQKKKLDMINKYIFKSYIASHLSNAEIGIIPLTSTHKTIDISFKTWISVLTESLYGIVCRIIPYNFIFIMVLPSVYKCGSI